MNLNRLGAYLWVFLVLLTAVGGLILYFAALPPR
jgi:hypothetical protein